jgi:hypothetical protein
MAERYHYLVLRYFIRATAAPDVEAFGETVEERPTATDGTLGTRER